MAQQGEERSLERGGARAPDASERREPSPLELEHDGSGGLHDLDAARRGGQLERSRVILVAAPLDEAGALQRAGELRYEHRSQPQEVGQFSLARRRLRSRERIERSQQTVLRRGEPERRQGPIKAGAPCHRESPDEMSRRRDALDDHRIE